MAKGRTGRSSTKARTTYTLGEDVEATDGSQRKGTVAATRFVPAHTVVSVRSGGRTWEIPEWNLRRAGARS